MKEELVEIVVTLSGMDLTGREGDRNEKIELLKEHLRKVSQPTIDYLKSIGIEKYHTSWIIPLVMVAFPKDKIKELSKIRYVENVDENPQVKVIQ